MNSEHCLLIDDEDASHIVEEGESADPSHFLQAKVIAFVRRPGALDYIFGRLLDANPDDQEVLAAAQLLIYAGQYYTRLDEVLPESRRAAEVLNAAEEGRFGSAEKRWPQAPIREKIEHAARRVIADHQSALPGILLWTIFVLIALAILTWWIRRVRRLISIIPARLLGVLSVVSLVLLFGAVALSLRAFGGGDYLDLTLWRVSAKGTIAHTLSLESDCNRLIAAYRWREAEPFERPPAAKPRLLQWSHASVGSAVEGFQLWSKEYGTHFWQRLGFDYTTHFTSVPEMLQSRQYCIALPFWVAFLLLAALPARCVMLMRSRQRRIARGLCAVCGYDLRASHDRCPECGTPIPAGLPRQPLTETPLPASSPPDLGAIQKGGPRGQEAKDG